MYDFLYNNNVKKINHVDAENFELFIDNLGENAYAITLMLSILNMVVA